jgi:hypothetical protein
MRYLPLLLFLACACYTTRPPVELQTQVVDVRAYTVEDARWITELATTLVPKVEELLGVKVPVPIVLDYDSRLVITGVIPTGDKTVTLTSLTTRGQTHTESVRNGRRKPQRVTLSVGTEATLRYVLAHELVHWSTPAVWHRLPITLEEGLCEHVAMQIEPEFGKTRRAALDEALARTTLAEFDEFLALDLTVASYGNVSGERKDKLYAVGRFVVEQLGIDRLRGLCERAAREGLNKIPSEWILELVKLPPNLGN